MELTFNEALTFDNNRASFYFDYESGLNNWIEVRTVATTKEKAVERLENAGFTIREV